MSPEKQRIKIAEACGWRIQSDIPQEEKMMATMCWVRPGNADWQSELLPDYLNDLNEMHEVVWYRRHDREFVQEYSKQLHKAVGVPEWATFAFENATATQRAEAFLRATGLWEETP